MENLGEKFNVDRFLTRCKERLFNTEEFDEIALYHMFVYLKERGWPKQWHDPTDFHKMFRQIDMFESGHLDMVMHNLINSSKIVWELFWEEYRLS